MALAGTATVAGSTPDTDARLTNDSPTSAGYTSNYTMVTGLGSMDAVMTECSRSCGRENEPAVATDPRNTSVIVGSANDYCAVYDDGNDADGAPISSGPVWLGYYGSENGGGSFSSSLVPGYPGDTTPWKVTRRFPGASADITRSCHVPAMREGKLRPASGPKSHTLELWLAPTLRPKRRTPSSGPWPS
jgi:hypothetical protein